MCKCIVSVKVAKCIVCAIQEFSCTQGVPIWQIRVAVWMLCNAWAMGNGKNNYISLLHSAV